MSMNANVPEPGPGQRWRPPLHAVLADEGLRSDNIHANAAGYAQMAHSVKATAQAVGLLARP